MLFRKNLLLLVTAFAAFSGFSQIQKDTNFFAACAENSYLRYLPVSKDSVQIIVHENYALGYSEKHEQALWVAYVLSSSECKGGKKRSSSFYVDPVVKTGSANDIDYVKSGYDRGHLAPAGDMAFSRKSMKESFYYSNMSPQVPGFNRGIWKSLESQVREWGKEYKRLLVITGPIFMNDTLPEIGPNKVTVPSAYYKIIVRPDSVNPQIISFLMWNKADDKPMVDFIHSLEKVESLTNIDFLPGMKLGKLELEANGIFWRNMGNKVYTDLRKEKSQIKKDINKDPGK